MQVVREGMHCVAVQLPMPVPHSSLAAVHSMPVPPTCSCPSVYSLPHIPWVLTMSEHTWLQ